MDIHFEIAALNDCSRRFPARSRSSEKGPDSRLQFDRAEWLGYVIVSSCIECCDFFDIGVSGGKNQDRSVGPFPYLDAYVDAAYIGQSEVEDDQCRTLGCGEVYSRDSGFRLEYTTEIVPERVSHDASDLRLIVDDKRNSRSHAINLCA